MKQESVTVSWLNPHIEFKAIFGLAEWTMMRVMMKKLSRRDSSQDGRYLIWYLIVQWRLPPTCSVHWTMSTTTATGGSFLRNTCVCNDTWLSIASPLDNLHCKLPPLHLRSVWTTWLHYETTVWWNIHIRKFNPWHVQFLPVCSMCTVCAIFHTAMCLSDLCAICALSDVSLLISV